MDVLHETAHEGMLAEYHVSLYHEKSTVDTLERIGAIAIAKYFNFLNWVTVGILIYRAG